MPRGGRRPGAGRKKGSLSSKTKARLALVERLSGDVMLAAMEDAVSRGDMRAAASFAKDAAPYMHPRLQAVIHAQPSQPDNPLDQLLRELDGKQRGIPNAH